MSTHRTHHQKEVFYFITFTCYQWLPLIKETHLYDYLELWFTRLHERGCLINAFVIMPNHIHMICFPKEESRGINHIIGEAKRFLAYEIVKRLKENGKKSLLRRLRNGVQPNEKLKKKLHHVFKLSFDAKEISGRGLDTVLGYIHHNPVKGKWQLADDFTQYPYSSAGYYELGKEKPSFLTDYRDI